MTTAPGINPAAEDRPRAAGWAECPHCRQQFRAILTRDRCPECREQLPAERSVAELYGPLARWWYASLRDVRFVLLVLSVLAFVQAAQLWLLARIGG